MSRILVSLLLLAACEAEPAALAPSQRRHAEVQPWSDAWILAQGERYLDDDAFRRAALEASLTEPSNVYSATRLSAYGLGNRGWDALPRWSPRVHPVDDEVVQALRSGERVLPEDAAPLWDGTRPQTFEAWAALGRAVFFGYPLRPEPQAAHALSDPELAAAVGLARGPEGWPGVVLFEDVEGEPQVGITCALCHTTVEDGVLVEGRARRDLDYGRMRLAWHEETGAPLPVALAARMKAWGPGRADITADDDEDPVAIVDLWGLRGLRHLTQAATLTHDGPAALAIRQETQILHANRERTRPPRELALALAIYLYTLQPPEPMSVDASAARRGQDVFESSCRRCHEQPNGSGPPVRAARVGTDANLANGTARGTGLYRPAPLLRVAQAGPYLHDGSVSTLEDLLGRDRFEDDYVGARGMAAVRGHAYGIDLPDAQRHDLLAYLRSL